MENPSKITLSNSQKAIFVGLSCQSVMTLPLHKNKPLISKSQKCCERELGYRIIDLLMGLFRGAVFCHGEGARKQPIKQPTHMPTSTMALMGRVPSSLRSSRSEQDRQPLRALALGCVSRPLGASKLAPESLEEARLEMQNPLGAFRGFVPSSGTLSLLL